MEDNSKQNLIDSFEERFQQMSQASAAEKERKRGELKRSKRGLGKSAGSAKGLGQSGAGGGSLAVEAGSSGAAIAVYKTRAAARKEYKPRAEGAFRRTVRLVKGLKEAKKQADALDYCTAENRRALYMAVVKDAWAPLCNAVENAGDTLWGFISSLGYDLLEIVVFIINLFIKIGYYLGGIFNFIRDIFWDIWLWLDVHKRGVFQIFAGVVSIIAMGLILISSMSAYEYSYYGRTLGIGAPYSMAVKGEGTVKAADGETITLAEDGITLRTSMIFGNSVREASGFFGIDDYENTMDFNLISSDINSRLEESFAGRGFVPGQKIRYAGVMDVDPRKPLPSAFEVIPVKLEAE